MRTLYESLLDDEETLFKSDEGIKDEINAFIKNNYLIKSKKYAIYTISDEPDVDGKYIVDCKGNLEIKNKNITSLTNDFFKFGVIDGNFYCDACAGLTSLEGAPEKVSTFSCTECISLTSLEGAPKYVENFWCSYCISLTSLSGAPEHVGKDFDCGFCFKLKTLKGAPKEVGGYFNCKDCESLTSLNGAPKEVGAGFVCTNCTSLTSLKGAPKKVGTDFYCSRCKVEFTKDDVNAVSKVKNYIYC